MSIAIMNKAWNTSLPPTEKLLLLSLADQANDDGVAWPSIESISKKTGVSERTVFRHLVSLEELGHLHREHRVGTSSKYHLHPVTDASVTPDNLTPLTPVSPTTDASVTPPLTPVSPTPDTVGIQKHQESSLNHQRTIYCEAEASRPQNRLNGKTEMVEKVLAYLNHQANRNYRTKNPNGRPTANAEIVAKRLKEGYTVEQLKLVIGVKSDQWMRDEKMDQYLNPQTLFRKSNFDKYLAEAEAE